VIMDNGMIYLFGDQGRAALRDFIDRKTLFAFDLDGTLAPIVADPSLIVVSDELRAKLSRLSRLTSVAIVTGRACADARVHLGFNPRFLVGNHGAEGLPGREEEEAGFVRLGSEWEAQLRQLLPDKRSAGIVIENKGATLALHYRNAPDPDMAQNDILNALRQLVPLPRRVSGKYVENLAPKEAPHKGEALSFIMRHLGCRRALFVGDDETDEDVFRLRDESIFGIRVEMSPRSAASYFIRETGEIETLLDELIGVVEKTKGNDIS
jgi:trehalose 6-phosphate phosphatase